jgi:predicted negative regulator of RcsB-dependent stress response
VDRLRRKELKQDRFVQEVGSTLDYVAEHKRTFVRYGVVVLVVALAALGGYWYTKSQHAARQAMLTEAFQVQQAFVTPQPVPGVRTFPTEAEKTEAAKKAFQKLAETHPSSDEGMIASYYLGVFAVQDRDNAGAEGHFKTVIDKADREYASLARLALAGVYRSDGKLDEAEKVLRPLLDNPTTMVSKEQAALELAAVLAETRPDEAKKLLEPLRTERSAISRAAMSALSELESR